MSKYQCKHCGNTNISEFRNTSDCGLCFYEGEKYFYFEHVCKCSYPMYVLANISFNKRFQVSEDDFTTIKAVRDKVAATKSEED